MKHQNPKFLAILLYCLGIAGLQAQTGSNVDDNMKNTLKREDPLKFNIDIAKVYYPLPVIDGVEEVLWDDVDPVDLYIPLGTEVPTVTAYWKAFYDEEYIYVLINVEDDDHYPAWESGGNTWDYDKPEIYFDVNDMLVDGKGPSIAGSGHYQFSPGFDQDGYGTIHEDTGTTQVPMGQYAYVLRGESYVYENAIAICSMSNKEGVAMTCWKLASLPEKIGFDMTVIDQDKGVTTSRQGYVWQSGDGTEAEAWNNMDASGTIDLRYGCNVCCDDGIYDNKTYTITVHPNPVRDFLNINADFDKVIINNILGQTFRSLEQISTPKINVGYLLKGVYFIKVYKGERYVGAARIMKI
jgi:hypothetical protein